MSVTEVGESSATVAFTMENADELYYAFKVNDNQPFTESELLSAQKITESKTITIETLTAETEYLLCAIAVGGEVKSQIQSTTFTTNAQVATTEPTVEILVEDIAQSSVLISYNMNNATAMYLNYRKNTGEITEEELLSSGKAYESVVENVMGLSPSTEYIVAAMAINEDTGEKSEIVSVIFTTLEPQNDDEVSFVGDFIVARLQYRGAVADYPEVGLYEGIFSSTETLTLDGSGFVFPDIEESVGLVVKVNAFNEYVDTEEAYIAPICGEYTISVDEVANFKIDQYTGNSYVSTINNGTPALYIIESGTMTITQLGELYRYDFDFMLQNSDDESEEPVQLIYSFLGAAQYDNTTIYTY